MRLGCKPFIAALNLYLKNREGLIAPSTYKEENKKLRYIGGLFDELKIGAKVKTTDPRYIDRADIQAFFGRMREIGLGPATQKKYVQLLNGLLKYCDNFVIEKMRSEGVKMPREGAKEIKALTVDESEGLLNALSEPKRWDEAVMLGAVALGLSTGCRPSELRMAEITDLDLKRGRFYVRHPKGEGSWASPQWVRLVRDDLVPHLERYLDERERRLKEKGRAQIKALFPSTGNCNASGFYSMSNFNHMKREIEKRTGFEFRIKDLRPTLASQTVDMNPSLLNAVSSQLRHSSVKTTQKYYAAINEGRAGEELREAWKSKIAIPPKTPLLAKVFPPAGYG
jgi:integrase/recombinase XerD